MTLSDARASIHRYVRDGVPTGGFLRAVIANDLIGACSKADTTSREIIFDLAKFMYNNVPMHVRGSYEAIESWLLHKRNESHDMFEEKPV